MMSFPLKNLDACLVFQGIRHRALLEHAYQNRNDGDDQEHEEQDLGNFGRARSNAAESEEGGDEGDNKKYNGVIKHDVHLSL
jgi:hypothetical protein